MAKLMDNLRGWYAASPPVVRTTVGNLIGLLPAGLVYGRTFHETLALIARAKDDAAFVQQEQLRRLRGLVAQAGRSPYYQDMFQRIYGGPPDYDRFTFDDLHRLPILTKDAIRNDPERFLTCTADKADRVSTSGSSGRPLAFYLDKDRGAKEFAFVTHIWSRIGYDYRTHRRAVFRGVHLDRVDQKPWQYDPALRELRLSPFHFTPENMGLFAELITQYRIDYLHGYPSSLIVFADWVIASGWQPPASLKGIFPVSEPTLPHQLERFASAFPRTRIMRQYGMSEKVLMAGQVGDDPQLYDSEPLYGYGELVDDSGVRITQPGETGRIIGTGFISMAMPLLRYDTEDVATLDRLPSADNGYRLRLRHIQGRWGEEYALGAQGELVSMSAINLHSDSYAHVHVFQLYQEKPGEVTIRVMPKPGVTHAMLEPFCQEIQAKVGASIRFELRLVEDIPFNTANGKRRFIDQKIDLRQYMNEA